MSGRGTIFTGESVRGIYADSKTQSRRVIKFPEHSYDPDLTWIKSIHPDGGGNWTAWSSDEPGLAEFTKRAYPKRAGFPCPYGRPGDILWVKETWRTVELPSGLDGIEYAADKQFRPIENTRAAADLWVDAHTNGKHGQAWRSPLFMPRWASRLSIRLLSVHAEQLQDITEANAKAEGVSAWHDTAVGTTYIPEFALRWDEINAKRIITRSDGRPGIHCAWNNNPWVWVLEFERVSHA